MTSFAVNTPAIYQPQRKIEGYIAGNKTPRPLAFKESFGNIGTTWGDVVSLDIEANQKNVMGQYVDPDVEVQRVQLPGIGSMDLAFGYTKELAGSPNYQEIAQRMLMEQPGAVTLESSRLARAYAENMQTQMSLAYERIENLYELARTNILLYGKHSVTAVNSAGQHREVTWDLGRIKLSNPGTNNQAARDAAYESVTGKNGDLVPEVDLTTLWANTSTAVAGGLSWDSWDATAGAAVTPTIANSPVKQLNRMIEVANKRAGCAKIFMSNDAYSWLVKDMNDNYANAADITIRTPSNLQIEMQIMPYVLEHEGLNFRMLWKTGKGDVPIYTYDGTYIDRITGQKKKYMPDGYVLCVPPSSYGAMRFGKILHLKAKWVAQQFWVNIWKNDRTGAENWEIHSNFAVYHTDINSVISWKVCTKAAPGAWY